MDENELRERVRELHAQGASTNAITRSLGVPRAQVAPLVRQLAREQTDDLEPAVIGCWVSAGWSVGLSVDADRDWPDDARHGTEGSGLAGVVVARSARHNRRGVSVCGYLVDTYCLGVKDALGPKAGSRGDLPGFVRRLFSAFDGNAVEAPMELASHLVWGAVDYAAGLGFRPHADFMAAKGHLDVLDGPCAIRFGHDGKPFYVQGPYDDAAGIMRTLHDRLGADNFHFSVEMDAWELV